VPAEPPVDFGAHDLAIGRGVVVAAEQRRGEHIASVLELRDSFVEILETTRCDRLPFRHGRRVQDAGDVVERERPGACR
jgi:hypothetical protein